MRTCVRPTHEQLTRQNARSFGMRSPSTMKSEEAVMPDAKKPDQSVGRGVRTKLSPSRRMNTSRTELGNRYSRGMVTVCERLFHPTRAVGLGVGVCIAIYRAVRRRQPLLFDRWKLSTVNFGPECCKHVCQRCIGRRPYSQPGSQGVPETGFAQIKFNPISVAKHRIVAGVETERPYLRETDFAALSFLTASVTSDLVDDALWLDGLDSHLFLRC